MLNQALVIDNGSGTCKSGFAGEARPRSVFSSVVGRPRYASSMVMAAYVPARECYIGESAQSKRGILALTYPIKHGVITNWDDMEKIWSHALYEELGVAPEEHPVLMSEALMSSKAQREHMTQIVFEAFEAPAFSVASQAVLSLFASGASTGMTIDCGDGVTQCAPIYDARPMYGAVNQLDFAGREITEYLLRLLNERGCTFHTSAEREIVREIKDRHCYVATNRSAARPKTVDYKLPDGQVLTLKNELHRCSEALFKPTLIGADSFGIPHAVNESISKCPLSMKQQLYANVVISGGTSMLPGFVERLEDEIAALAPQAGLLTVANPNRQYAAWIGGSKVVKLSSFREMWISLSEYQEFGASIVHRKRV